MKKRFAFTDPSGGGGRETFPVAIAELSFISKKAVLVALHDKRPPFSPDAVVEEYAKILKSYGVSVVTGDRYGGTWPAERFAAHGIRYEASTKTKSEIFLEFLALVNSGRVRIPHDKRLRQQFIQLERRTSRSGRDSVDHPPSGFDDLANAAAGALCLAAASSTKRKFFEPFTLRVERGSHLAEDRDGDRFWHRQN